MSGHVLGSGQPAGVAIRHTLLHLVYKGDLQKQPEGHPVLLTFFDSSAAFSTRPQEIFCCVEVMIEANPPNDIKGLAL